MGPIVQNWLSPTIPGGSFQYYLDDDVQYFPFEPPSKLANGAVVIR